MADIKKKVYSMFIDEEDMDAGVFAISLVESPAIEANWITLSKQLKIELDKQPEKIEPPAKLEKPIYGVMSIEQMITKIKAAGYKVMRRTEGWEEI